MRVFIIIFGVLPLLVSSTSKVIVEPPILSSTSNLSDLEIQLNSILNTYPIYHDHLIEVLESCGKYNTVDKSGQLVWDFWKFPMDLKKKRSYLFDSFEKYQIEIPSFLDLFQYQMSFRNVDFSDFTKLIDQLSNSKENLTNDSLAFDFLTRFNAIENKDYCYERLTDTLVSHLKLSPPEYFETLVESLKTWNSLDSEAKEVAKSALTDINPMHCLDMWNLRNRSEALTIIVEMFEKMDGVMGTDSCFWKIRTMTESSANLQPYSAEFRHINFTDVNNTTLQLSSYFKRTPLLDHGTFLDILESAETHNVIDNTGRLVLDIWDLQNQTNPSPSKIFSVYNKYLKMIPHLSWRFRTQILHFRTFNFDFITLVTGKFRILDEESRKIFITRLEDSHDFRLISPSLFKFFKTLSTLKEPLYWIQRLSGELIRHTKWSPSQFFEDIAISIRTWETISNEKKKLAMSILTNEIDPFKCIEMYKEWKKPEVLGENAVKMIHHLDDSIGTSSCLKRVHHKLFNQFVPSSDSSYEGLSIQALNTFFEGNPLLKYGNLIQVLEDSKSSIDLVNNIGKSVIAFWDIADRKSTESFFEVIEEYNEKIPNFAWNFQLLTVDFEKFDFAETSALVMQFEDLKFSEKKKLYEELRTNFDHLPSSKAIFDFFKRFDNLLDGLKTLERFAYTLNVQVNSHKSQDFYKRISKVIRKWTGSSDSFKENTRRLINDKASDSECYKIYLGSPSSVTFLRLAEKPMNIRSCFSYDTFENQLIMGTFLKNGLFLKNLKIFNETGPGSLEINSQALKDVDLIPSFLSRREELKKKYTIQELKDSQTFAESMRSSSFILHEIKEVVNGTAVDRKRFLSEYGDPLISQLIEILKFKSLNGFISWIENTFLPEIQDVDLIRSFHLIRAFEKWAEQDK